MRQLTGVDELPRSLTFLFEVICKGSRGIARYDFEGLALLAVMDRSSDRELDWQSVQAWADRLGCRTPRVYPFGTLAEAIESRARLPANLEGYVIRFASGFRVKVKGDAYLALYKRAASLSEDRLLQELAGGTIESFLVQSPEEFRREVEQALADLARRAAALEAQALELFERRPPGADRKTFALWVQTEVPPDLRAPLFQLFGDKVPNWYKILRSTRYDAGPS